MGEMHDRLREARELAGYESASVAADRLGVPKPTYIGHENGHRGFDVDAAIRYANAFKVNLLWLLRGIGDPRDVSIDQQIADLPPEKQQEVLRFLDFVRSAG